MTTTYNGTNITLEYDAATATWGFKNTAQDFIDTNTFSTADPSFKYAPVPSADNTEPEPDPCPPGYMYDKTLKQCVPDPNYQNPFVREQPQGGSDDNFSDTNKIPSNETKENWIKNANIIIPPGEEGAGKTGYQNYIDNLKERGFTKVVDGKLVFKTDSLGSKIGSAMLARFGMGDEPEAKTNKIIKDLQRMGGVNAEITMNDDGEIEYISELELADAPGTFATYNYDTGDNYTGFTTPATNILGVQTFKTWEDYVKAVMQPFTNTYSSISNINTTITSTIDKEKERKAKFDADIAQIKADKEKIKKERDMQKLIKEAEEREKLKNELDDMIPKGDDKDKKNIVKGPNPGDAGGTSTYSSGSSSPSTGQSVGPVGAPVSVTIPRGPDLTNR
jgi:hypothetical protein